MSVRTFVRCPLCLSIAAVEGDIPAGLVCECGGAVDIMGVVQGDRLHIGTEFRCPCDDRCTSAKGPNCSCSCGGKNHGTNRVLRIEHFDSIPTIRSGSIHHGVEFKAALEQARATIDARYGRKNGWETEAVYFGRQDAWKAFHRAQGMKSHKGRMRVLAGLVAPLSATETATAEQRAETERQAAAAEQARLDAIAAAKAQLVHVGAIGERITVQATVEIVIRMPGAGYTGGTKYLVKFRDAAGNQLVTFTEMLMVTIEADGHAVPEWQHVEITGTVKTHGQYDGEPQTVLTRVKAKALQSTT